MERAYKWLGGIGYILSFVPYIGFAALILVAIAWIMMGREVRQTIFKAAGILMILSAVTSILLLVFLPILVPLSLASLIPPVDSAIGEAGAPQLIRGSLGILAAFAAIVLAVMAVGVASFVVELLSHFRASRIFGVSWFKYAGWMRVAALASAAMTVPLLLALIPSLTLKSPHLAEILGAIITVIWPVAVAILLGIMAIVFSAIAFFSIPEPPPPPQEYRPRHPT